MDPGEVEAVRESSAESDAAPEERMTRVQRPPDGSWPGWTIHLVARNCSRRLGS